MFLDFFNKRWPIVFRPVFGVEFPRGIHGYFGVKFVDLGAEGEPHGFVRFEKIRKYSVRRYVFHCVGLRKWSVV